MQIYRGRHKREQLYTKLLPRTAKQMNEILRDNYHNMVWTQDIVYREWERAAVSLERDGEGGRNKG